MYEAIKSNNVSDLKEVLSYVKYVNDVVFNQYHQNHEVKLDCLSYTNKPPLNPILLSLYYGSEKCLAELLTKFPRAIREALRGDLDQYETVT